MDGRFPVPEPEYSIKGVRFRYDKPRNGTGKPVIINPQTNKTLDNRIAVNYILGRQMI
mgnify:CR=1 FL=1